VKALAFDPGAHCGWTAAQQLVPGQRPEALGVGILDRKLPSGSDARVAEALELMARFQPDVIFVETVLFVVPRAGLGADMAGHLSSSARLGGRIYQAAEDHGYPVAEVTAERWRKCIVGNARAENADIKRVVLVRYSNWPGRTNNHERDAGGLCAFGLEAALMARRAAFTSELLQNAVEALS
jgi:Holliday junction resolvasome RuvABC endonuclease subunit